MAEEILRCRAIARLGYRVQDEYEEQLQTICDENLSLVLEDNVVVWHAPCRRVVFEGLQQSEVRVRACEGTHRIEKRAENGQNDLLVGTSRNVRDGLYALDW